MNGMEMLNRPETPPSSFTVASGVNSFKAAQVFLMLLFLSSHLQHQPLFCDRSGVYQVKSAEALSSHLTSPDQTGLWMERAGG